MNSEMREALFEGHEEAQLLLFNVLSFCKMFQSFQGTEIMAVNDIFCAQVFKCTIFVRKVFSSKERLKLNHFKSRFKTIGISFEFMSI